MIQNVIVFFISLFFWAGAFLQGYFFDVVYLAAGLIFITASSIILMFVRKIKVTLFHILLVSFVLTYWLVLWHAIDFEHALLTAAKVSLLIPLSFLSTMLTPNHFLKLMKQWAWIGATVTIWGIFFDMTRNNRLESTIFYANALAILLLIALIISLILFLKERRNIYLLLSWIHSTGLLLTFSRSVWVLWLSSILVLFLLYPWLRTKVNILKIGAVHIVGFATTALIKKDLLFFWQRVQTIHFKASEFQTRTVYWKDSLKMIREHWIFGTGGGGWKALSDLYHSENYFVSFVHNHYLQVALDTGLIGFTLFISFIGIYYFSIFRSYVQKASLYQINLGFALIITILLIHSGFDFDLSFPLLFGFLIVVMGYEAQNLRTVWEIHLRHVGKLILVLFLLIEISFYGWLTQGYAQKQAASQLLKRGETANAVQYYLKAKNKLPWSHTVNYGLAKSYILLGNQSGIQKYYLKARTELHQSLQKVPRSSLYQTMIENLNNPDK